MTEFQTVKWLLKSYRLNHALKKTPEEVSGDSSLTLTVLENRGRRRSVCTLEMGVILECSQAPRSQQLEFGRLCLWTRSVETERRELGTWAQPTCVREAVHLQAGCAWSGSQRERETRSSLMPSELPQCQAEQAKGTGAKCGLLFLCRLWQTLCLSLCLCFPVWIWGIPMKYKY